MKKSLPFVVIAALGFTGCSVADQAQNTDDDAAAGSVTIMTHDSFNVDEELVAAFEEETGYTVTTTSPGDAGAVLNQLILQKDNPTVDAVYGIDNYSAQTLLDEDMLTSHDAELGSAERFALEADTNGHLAPIDHGQSASTWTTNGSKPKTSPRLKPWKTSSDPAMRDCLSPRIPQRRPRDLPSWWPPSPAPMTGRPTGKIC